MRNVIDMMIRGFHFTRARVQRATIRLAIESRLCILQQNYSSIVATCQLGKSHINMHLQEWERSQTLFAKVRLRFVLSIIRKYAPFRWQLNYSRVKYNIELCIALTPCDRKKTHTHITRQVYKLDLCKLWMQFISNADSRSRNRIFLRNK